MERFGLFDSPPVLKEMDGGVTISQSYGFDWLSRGRDKNIIKLQNSRKCSCRGQHEGFARRKTDLMMLARVEQSDGRLRIYAKDVWKPLGRQVFF
jgi:hypothetical protein